MATSSGPVIALTRRARDAIYRDIREALRFSQRAFNARRYDDARHWAYIRSSVDVHAMRKDDLECLTDARNFSLNLFEMFDNVQEGT